MQPTTKRIITVRRKGQWIGHVIEMSDDTYTMPHAKTSMVSAGGIDLQTQIARLNEFATA